ncbi:MAG: DJ-1/PfpI family protein [Actinomycetota bacterium]|nr:DJ-1/PfpI family protein [Actinomycetota bacterium]
MPAHVQAVPILRPRHVLVLGVEGCLSLDVLGPVEVFCFANGQVPEAYRVEIVGPTDGGTITMSNGVRLGVAPLPEPPPRHDTLVVAGGAGARRAVDDVGVVDWIARAAERAERTTSVCTGACLLAAAGLLDGRRATTHWRFCDALASDHPAVQVEPDSVFTRDGDVWTSAGVTAGIDLALALVEEDLGPEVALAVARLLVVFLKRPGGQSQFSGALAAQQAAVPALRELQTWIAGNLAEDLSVAVLATRANLSERSFARAFRREVGQTPAAYVEALRIERAQTLLQDGASSLEAVARASGFASAEVLRRAFHRHVGVGPAAYRERFTYLPGYEGTCNAYSADTTA